MSGVVHFIDRSDPHEVRLGLRPLLDRVAAQRLSQAVWQLGGPRRPDLGRQTQRFPALGGVPWCQAVVVQRRLRAIAPELVHAWGAAAGLTALAAAPSGQPICVSVWDPVLDRAAARWVLALRGANVHLLCHTGVVQRRWVERGWPAERAVVVRPGVDFGAITRWRRAAGIRHQLGLPVAARLVAMPGWPADRGGHRTAVLAVSSAHQFAPDRTRLVVHSGLLGVPGVQGFADALPAPGAFHATDEPLEQLLSEADVLLMPASGEVSATPLAWAMAAGVPIIAAATYATAEFLADGHNARLVKPGEALPLAARLRDAVGGLTRPELAEVARGQAFQAFGLTRYVEQVKHAWENVLAGRPVGADMVDAALDG